MNKLRGQLPEEPSSPGCGVALLFGQRQLQNPLQLLLFSLLLPANPSPKRHKCSSWADTVAFIPTLTCPAPPAPDRTAPWRCAAARRSWTPRRSVPTAATLSRRCRTAGSSWSSPEGRRRGAGWGPPRPPALCRPVRWTETPGWPWKRRGKRDCRDSHRRSGNNAPVSGRRLIYKLYLKRFN